MNAKSKGWLSRSDLPNWGAILIGGAAFLLSVGVNYFVDTQRSAQDRLAAAVIADVQSFERKATEFNMRFGSFALQLREAGNVEEKRKVKVIENLTSQYSQIDQIKKYMPAAQQREISLYQDQLHRVQSTILETKNFDDLGRAYREVGTLLDRQHDIMELLRESAGLLAEVPA